MLPLLIVGGLVGPVLGHGPPRPAYGAPPPAEPHAHGGFGGADDLKDAQHIKSHLEGEIDTEAEWSDEKIKFFYFKMFDSSKDNHLDGLEIFQAIRHNDEEHANSTQPGTPPEAPLSEADVEAQTDKIMADMDKDLDGFIGWPEFVEYVDKIGLAV